MANRYPTVDMDTCIGDRECVEVCTKKNVYDWDEDNAKPIVARPDDCDACLDCVKACPVEAITIPEE